MAEDPHNPTMVPIGNSEIGYRVTSDCRALYISKLENLIKNCPEAIYSVETIGWDTLTRDADTNCISRIRLKHTSKLERVFVNYNQDFKNMLLRAWGAKGDNAGLQFMALTQASIPAGGHFINDELFRIVVDLRLEKVGSLVQQGKGEFDVEVRLEMQYLAMSRKLRFGQHSKSAMDF